MPQNETIQVIEDLVTRLQSALASTTGKDLLVPAKAIEILTTQTDERRRLSAYLALLAAQMETNGANPVAAIGAGVLADTAGNLTSQGGPFGPAPTGAYPELLSARARAGSVGDSAVPSHLPDALAAGGGTVFSHTYPWHDTAANRLYEIRLSYIRSSNDTRSVQWVYQDLATFEYTTILNWPVIYSATSYATGSYPLWEDLQFCNFYTYPLRSSASPTDVRPVMISFSSNTGDSRSRVTAFIEGDPNPIRHFFVPASNGNTVNQVYYDAEDRSLVIGFATGAFFYRVYWDGYVSVQGSLAAGAAGADPAGALVNLTGNPFALAQATITDADPTRFFSLAYYGYDGYNGPSHGRGAVNSTLGENGSAAMDVPSEIDGNVSNVGMGGGGFWDARSLFKNSNGAQIGSYRLANMAPASPLTVNLQYLVLRPTGQRVDLRHTRLSVDIDWKMYYSTLPTTYFVRWVVRRHYTVEDLFGRVIRQGTLQNHDWASSDTNTAWNAMLPWFYDEARDHLHVMNGRANAWYKEIYLT